MADFRKHRNTFIIEDVNIWAGRWRNFAGEGGTYNAEGSRNFWIEVPEDLAMDMKNDHWNVKERPDDKNPDLVHYIVKININYRSNNPPEIYLYNRKRNRKTLMDEDVIYRLDRAYITNADISFNQYTKNWPDGKVTTTGWLQQLVVEIEENYLQEKYADVPDSSAPEFEDPDSDLPF